MRFGWLSYLGLLVLTGVVLRPAEAARTVRAAAPVPCATPEQVQRAQQALMQKVTVLFAYEWGPSDIKNFGGTAEAQAVAQLDRVAMQVPQQQRVEKQEEWRSALRIAKVRSRVFVSEEGCTGQEVSQQMQ